MYGIDHWPIYIKNIAGEEFVICSPHGCGHPRDRWPLEFGRFGNISAFDFLYGFWPKDLEQLRDFVFSLDNPGQHIEFGQSPTAPLHLDRVEDALKREEVLVYALGDPDEAALKALRQQIRLILSQTLIQERAEAARLHAVHKRRTPMEKAGALFTAGAEGLGEAGLSFLTWGRDVYEVLSIHQRQYRMVVAAWEAYNTATGDDWVKTFQRKLAAAEHKELVEALGFDPWKIDRAMLAGAYATVNLVWEDDETWDMVVAFARDYARAQHSLEWAKIAGGGAFEIVLTAVLVAVTGGIGAAAMLAGKARLLVLLKRLGALFEELAKLSGKVKLRRDREKCVASRESRLEDYVTDEKVPRSQPPPKGNADNDRDDREDQEDHGNDEEKSTSTVGGEDIVSKSGATKSTSLSSDEQVKADRLARKQEKAARVAAGKKRKAEAQAAVQQKNLEKGKPSIIPTKTNLTEVFFKNGKKFARVDAGNGIFIDKPVSSLESRRSLRLGVKPDFNRWKLEKLSKEFKTDGGFRDNILVTHRIGDELHILVGNNRF